MPQQSPKVFISYNRADRERIDDPGFGPDAIAVRPAELRPILRRHCGRQQQRQRNKGMPFGPQETASDFGHDGVYHLALFCRRRARPLAPPFQVRSPLRHPGQRVEILQRQPHLVSQHRPQVLPVHLR